MDESADALPFLLMLFSPGRAICAKCPDEAYGLINVSVLGDRVRLEEAVELVKESCDDCVMVVFRYGPNGFRRTEQAIVHGKAMGRDCVRFCIPSVTHIAKPLSLLSLAMMTLGDIPRVLGGEG